eukprot:RCo023075
MQKTKPTVTPEAWTSVQVDAGVSFTLLLLSVSDISRSAHQNASHPAAQPATPTNLHWRQGEGMEVKEQPWTCRKNGTNFSNPTGPRFARHARPWAPEANQPIP